MKDEIERKKEKVTLIEAHSYTIVEKKDGKTIYLTERSDYSYIYIHTCKHTIHAYTYIPTIHTCILLPTYLTV